MVDLRDSRPLGIFDSGIGGLTVLRALHARLPYEGTVYLGDTARVPYGSRSPRTVCRYAVNNASFLIKESDIKILIVACNTVSAVAMTILEDILDVPVLGVVSPGAKLAAKTSVTGRIAVIGTNATIASKAYQKALENIDSHLEVYARSCPLFVPLAEEGWVEGPVVHQVIEKYLGDLPELDVDTVVLGCTHYPLLKSAISEVLGPINLVDSAEAVAQDTEIMLHDMGLSCDLPSKESTALISESKERSRLLSSPQRKIFVTDVADAFEVLAERFLGEKPGETEQVDIPT